MQRFFNNFDFTRKIRENAAAFNNFDFTRKTSWKFNGF